MNMFIYFVIGILAGAVGSVSSGGGLLSIPLLLFLGIPPITTVATTRFASFSGGVTSLYQYHKKKRIHWRYVPWLAIPAVCAGLIGPRLLVHMKPKTIETVIGFALIALFFVLFASKQYGLVSVKRHRKHKAVGAVLTFFGMLYAVMFGAGGGAIIVNLIMYFYGMVVTESIATGMAVWLIGTGVAVVNYILLGQVNFSIAVPLIAGSLIGGYVGANVAVRYNPQATKRVLAVIVLLSGLKLLL